MTDDPIKEALTALAQRRAPAVVAPHGYAVLVALPLFEGGQILFDLHELDRLQDHGSTGWLYLRGGDSPYKLSCSVQGARAILNVQLEAVGDEVTGTSDEVEA